MDLWEMIASILTGLIVCVPLVIKLVQVTREAVRKGRWDQIVSILAGYMAEAEIRFKTGASRKEWVMGMMAASAEKIDYPFTDEDWTKISDMIDYLCTMARVVNGPEGEDQ